MDKRIIPNLSLVLVILVLCGCGGNRYFKRAGGRTFIVGYSIALQDDTLYLASNDGFLVYSVANPAQAVKLGEFVEDTVLGIFVEGDVGYLASSDQLVTVDISDPALPIRMGSYRIGGIAHSVVVQGGFAYLGGNSGGYILDVSDPGAPALVSEFASGQEVADLEVKDLILYAAVPSRGVHWIDISDPASPSLEGTIPDTQGVKDIDIADGLLYAACFQRGVKIIDHADLDRPRTVGSYWDDDGGEALAVWEGEGVLYVADNFQIEALDLSDPAHPAEIGEYTRISAAHDLVGQGSFLYIAAGSLLILEVEP